jgi:hypothetical protein
MSFWEKIQKDIKKNIREGLAIVREGSTVVSGRIEKLTELKVFYTAFIPVPVVFLLNIKVSLAGFDFLRRFVISCTSNQRTSG